MSVWLGAAMVTAGLSVAMLAGTGVALAATEPGANSETTTSDTERAEPEQTEPSEQTEQTEQTEPDDADVPEADGDLEEEIGDEETDLEEETGAEETDLEETGTGETVGDETVADEADTDEADTDAEQAAETDSEARGGDAPVTLDPIVDSVDTATELAVEEPSVDAVPAAGTVAAPDPQPENVTETATESVLEPTPAVARLAVVAQAADDPAAATAAPQQTLLSIFGTVVFNLYSFVVRVFGGPPLLPWGSTVTVKTSTLEIDCGDGYEVPADWYVPEGPTPTNLIYLQHGFLAAGPFYSYTAARLAEATHSIVVATSLTSNFLACDGCWLGGTQMHKAVADLFIDGNTALGASAAAAGYSGTLLDGVEKVALVGHSLGGGLVAGTSGYMQSNGTADRLAGVVMLDGVGFGTTMPEALAKLPDEFPIYNIAGMAYFWNMNGSGGAALEEEFPGKFNGVRLLGGLHSDPMAGGNPLIQIGLYAVTGFSWPVNVKAPEILSAAWINDMFAGTAPSPTSPYYGAPKFIMSIATPYGTAKAYVQPGPPETLSILDVVFGYISKLVFSINFATCAAPPTENVAISAPNTLLSLDGTAKPRQSIAQHVCIG
ncbi:hypothetical protein [Mycolicibacterium sp. CR10]|uniref:hypothetical protein n=1 Tax=Mycolicibacterium sp. CR10 TaxID=2562314 RepID=UPI001F0FFAF7|nr:hypothetical protein [Mycolicibacterium sp. CR10]